VRTEALRGEAASEEGGGGKAPSTVRARGGGSGGDADSGEGGVERDGICTSRGGARPAVTD